jgi:F-type H+-transporting ATPase subunit delta
VDISSGIQASLAGRYALALFDLAREEKQIESVGASLATLRRGLAESADLRALTSSPLIGRKAAVEAIMATAESMGIDPLTRNFLGVLARNGRLTKIEAVIRAFDQLSAGHRGEISAEVTSAHPLADDQIEAIRSNLRTRMGRDIAVEMNVDPAILGGLVVKIGSQRIDGSIRTKLNNVASAMKG